MKQIALFAFNGEIMCFVHVLLTAIDMNEKGYNVKIIIEGLATKLVPEMSKDDNPMHNLFQKAKQLDLIDGACKACSGKMGALDAVQREGFKLLDEMKGHPSMARYREDGFEIITF